MKKILLVAAVFILFYLFINPYYLFPDGQGYFSYLPSMHFDSDLQLYNDFKALRIPVPLALTKTGYIANNWSFGSAMFWTPFYLAGKLAATDPVNPYGLNFWFWVNSGTIFYGFFTLLLLYAILKKIGLPGNALLLSCLLFVGTPALFYTGIISSTAHGITAFVAAVFVWYWLYSFTNYNSWRYAALGIIAGLGFCVRTQEAIIVLMLVPELLFELKKAGYRTTLRSIFFLFLGFIIGASPQLFVWKVIYGSFFYAPSGFNIALKYFDIKDFLFSSYHGLFIWTPIFLTGFLGILLGLKRLPRLYYGILIVFTAQVLINSCVVCFWEGYSFSMRQMTSSFVLAALGCGEILVFSQNKSRLVKAAGWLAVVLPCLWAAGLLLNYFNGLDLFGFTSFSDLLHLQASIFSKLVTVAGKLAAHSRPDFKEFLMMFCFACAMYLVLASFKKNVQNRARRFAVMLACIALVFDFLIFKCSRNKPDYDMSHDNIVTPQQLDDFFMLQVAALKDKYKLK